jgi:endoglucanase
MKKYSLSFICLFIMSYVNTLNATKLVVVKVVDKDYLQVNFIDGQVNFIDDGKGPCAFQSACHEAANNSVVRYGAALDTVKAVLIENWKIKSADDPNYSLNGSNPLACYRKSKLNGMAEMDWSTTLNDFVYEYTREHTIYLKLPHSMVQGKNYTLDVNANTNSDVLTQTILFDIFKSRSEAVHVNLVGYLDDNSIKASDLFIWLGDGGARDYSGFEGNKVFVYEVNKNTSQQAGTIAFWKSSASEAGGYNLTASNVWKADFTGFKTPGKYRVAIEGVGCSEDFEIKNDVYFEPFLVSVRGFFYMRIGQDSQKMVPVTRQPLYIPHKSPSNTKVIITAMQPFHKDWNTFSKNDYWDYPYDWAPYSKPGNPENNNAFGGHADAMDWDRHLGHISIIYDMLLPFILTDGKLADDNLGIAESGNGIPDILDEARNEVDFWLRLRDGRGYSHGLTIPDSSNVFYQAGTSPVAAWANAANSAMLAYCFQVAGLNGLMKTYKDSAVAAYNSASALTDQKLDAKQDVGMATLKGKDMKMMAAAYLYNITGNTEFEDVVNSLSTANSNTSPIANDTMNQLWACAGYLKTKQTVHYPALLSNMKTSVIHEAKNVEANFINTRPSRRATDNNTGYFKTIQNVQRTMVAHAVSTDEAEKLFFGNALVLEADWGLGRNSLNIIYMTTATTKLAYKRSIENAYTPGRDDGTPGLDPGHTPYINTDDWSPSMVMGRPSWMTSKCYPEYSGWPKAECYFNTRYVWSHSEFTPQQTMRGKTALYGYLYGLYKSTPGL